MVTTSEYQFPIFISSTEIDLKDLRAELSYFLASLGYSPKLSSSIGFPDKTPNLEPWESCLPVLDHCFVVILIIDGRYGTPLEWPHFVEFFEGKRFSPTHGEYIYAHKRGKRILVFVRDEIAVHYQTYRSAVKKSNSPDEARQLLEKALPDYVSYEVLDFFGSVKTARPIPWISTFRNVIDIKNEVQKRLLNEFAEYFMIKNNQIEVLAAAFDKALQDFSQAKRDEILRNLSTTGSILKAKKEIEDLTAELSEEVIESRRQREEKEEKIRELQGKIDSMGIFADASTIRYIPTEEISRNYNLGWEPFWDYRPQYKSTKAIFSYPQKSLEAVLKETKAKLDEFIARERINSAVPEIVGESIVVQIESSLRKPHRETIYGICQDAGVKVVLKEK